MALVKNGFTLKEALSLSRRQRVAMLIVSGEIDGGEFDYQLWRWKEKK